MSPRRRLRRSANNLNEMARQSIRPDINLETSKKVLQITNEVTFQERVDRATVGANAAMVAKAMSNQSFMETTGIVVYAVDISLEGEDDELAGVIQLNIPLDLKWDLIAEECDFTRKDKVRIAFVSEVSREIYGMYFQQNAILSKLKVAVPRAYTRGMVWKVGIEGLPGGLAREALVEGLGLI